MVVLSFAVIAAALCLSGIRGDSDLNPQLLASKQSVGLECADACDETGDVLECQIKVEDSCVTKNYLVCVRKEGDVCRWSAVSAPCAATEEEVRGVCSKAGNMRGTAPGKPRRQLGLSPAVTYRLSSITRRDLSGNDRPVLESRSSMVSTSGNGHAYAYDGNSLVESHFGSGPMFRPVLPSSQPNLGSLFNFNPFSLLTKNTKTNANAAGSYAPQSDPTGRDPYKQVFSYPYMYQPNYGYGSNDISQNAPSRIFGFTGNSPGLSWEKPPPQSSPFAGVFQSVGLRDPMEMLQYFPIML